MARLKSYILGGVTLVCALAIGYIMQYGFAVPDSTTASGTTDAVEVTDITLTSSGLGTPNPPIMGLRGDDAPQPPARSEPVMIRSEPDPMALAAVGTVDTVVTRQAQQAVSEPEIGFACDTSMDATTTAGAMVSLRLDATCHASERVTIHHQGMMFTEVMQPDGILNITVPALTENALFIASFTNGEGATASAVVNSLPFYDRIAVQWKGETGLQLHAREFDADYFTSGHIWSGAAGDLAAAAAGESGFLVRLGQSDAPEALIAEVYTFPSGTAKKSGDVTLSVEAEVTNGNCSRQIEAQTLDLRAGGTLRVGDLTLEIPECDSVGDFLVLKNILADLKVAAR
ncbi:translocase [Primorskyibacter sp. 2E107]|uniref:translocase n=1 Tax=Primorskyibacter sp. 2E107 TaxID=3403458 RepID=UPI003AF798D0